MQNLDTIHDYLRTHSEEIGNRILSSYPALFGAGEAPSRLLSQMLRTPYPAQTLAIMGVSKRWQLARNANVVAECGTGKTLIALGSMLVHGAGNPFTGLVMAPGGGEVLCLCRNHSGGLSPIDGEEAPRCFSYGG